MPMVDATQLKFRIKTNLYERVAAAADARGVSLNKEIAERLERSLDPNLDVDKVFGSRALFGLLKAIGVAMHLAGQRAKFFKAQDIDAAKRWIDDPYAYD